MLNWAHQFSILLFLDNNNYPTAHTSYECLLGAGAAEMIDCSGPDPLASLQQTHDNQPEWMFGHICYDYKNILEPKLNSSHPAQHGYPLIQFFVPETVCHISRNLDVLTIATFGNPATIYSEVIASSDTISNGYGVKQAFGGNMTEQSYLDTVNQLREHIAAGDCYEINYCYGGSSPGATIAPLETFHALNSLSPAPFAAWYRLDDQYMMCASPERYLCRKGEKLISQPIKGTARREQDPAADQQTKENLKNSIKERAENVMIVDLVRNDLARCCITGSVTVDELCGIYTFPQVHQMISTVSGTLLPDAPFTDAIRVSFPMGSMTGAPKFKVMQLIDQYEPARRELFSGTVGYITPGGDFDFNVVIRSLFYNAVTQLLSYQAGGAITYDSDAAAEWAEMRLKSWALERIFQ